jgi:glucosylceramidase
MRSKPFIRLALAWGLSMIAAGFLAAEPSLDAAAYVTAADLSQLLQKHSLDFAPREGKTDCAIVVDEKLRYQEMVGFGASFTDSSAYLVREVLSAEARAELMKRLFSYEDGIGLSLLRQPMGASDFALEAYTYDDMPVGEVDPELKNFSIRHDTKYIVPAIREALAINPSLRIMASPWSPPAWMKVHLDAKGGEASLFGGKLDEKYYAAYAHYFLKFIEAYEAEGIPICAVTPQNEPMYLRDNYPTSWMPPAEQSLFIGGYLGPLLRKAGRSAKILCWDFVWSHPEYVEAVLSSPAAGFVAGSAWHNYEGEPPAMSRIHEKFPDKEIWFTEGGGGSWFQSGHWGATFESQMSQIIRIASNWSNSVLFWNIALDRNGGPVLYPNTLNRGLATINPKTSAVEYNVDYYAMGHISRFVRPGAYRIGSRCARGEIENVAFQNPDGGLVALLHNPDTRPRAVSISWRGNFLQVEMPPKSGATVVW